MKIKTKTRTEGVLAIMHILAWLAFIAYTIKAGAILVSFGISCVNPEAARNLFLGLNMYNLSQFNFWHYTLSVFLMVDILGMKALAFFLAIKILMKVNMVNPFKIEVARLIQRIGIVLLITWFIAVAANAHTDWLLKKTGELQGDWVETEFIFMAVLVFIISQVFKRGVEIQTESNTPQINAETSALSEENVYLRQQKPVAYDYLPS
jgi:hypothetical protein